MNTIFNSSLSGRVIAIQRCSFSDGPGIRTVIFLKGCPLACLWCHNPESQSLEAEILYTASRCIGCGRCAEICPRHHKMINGFHQFIHEGCTGCGRCVEVCPAALELCGINMTVQEVMEEALADRDFYGKKGGITISGGEPFMQDKFLLELVKAAKSFQIGTAVETCGMTEQKNLQNVARYTDFFLYDIKETDSERHYRFTGTRNERIMENLAFLEKLGARVILRVPVIPTCNDRQEHFHRIAVLAQNYSCVQEVHILAYHRAGENKAVQLGRTPCSFPVPDRRQVEGYADSVAAFTTKKVKII